MNPLFFVRYEPRLMLVDTLDLTPEEELAHRRLCDWVWSQDRWPAAAHKVTMQVARVAAASWPRVLRSLRLKGWRVNRGLLYHGGVHRTLREAKDAHASAVARGRKGGQSRTPPSPAQAQLQHQQPHPQSQPQHANPAERSTLSASPLKKPARKEAEFMRDVQTTMTRHSPATARREMDNWGGWWRNRYREDPDKARRVLADIGSMIAEHRITATPGAAATDLWARLP